MSLLKIKNKVSVVIPVYNSEKYLLKAIESIIKQNLKGIEIIIVDDGSTDNSKSIAEGLAKKYENIKIISQENAGPGAARNKGIKIASGEYITFLDADDYYPNNIFCEIYKLLKKYSADVFIGNILCFNDVRTWHLPYMKDIFLDKSNIKTGKLDDMPEINLTPSVCNKWFKLDSIIKNQIYFEEKIKVGEDLLFTQKAYINSNMIIKKNIDIYNYRLIDNTSLIKSNSMEFFKSLIEVQNKLIHFLKENNIYDKKILLRQLVFFVDSIFLKVGQLISEEIDLLIDLGIEIFKISNNVVFDKSNFKSFERYFLAVLLNTSNKIDIRKLIDNCILNKPRKELIKFNKNYYSYLINDFEKYKDFLEIEPLFESKAENAYFKDDNTIIIRGYGFVRGIEFSNEDSCKRKLILRGKNNTIIKDVNNDYRTDLTYLFNSDGLNYNWGGYKPIKINLDELCDDEYEVFLKIIIGKEEFLIPFEFRLAEVKNKLKVKYLENNREVFCKFLDGKRLFIRIRTLSKRSYLKSNLRRIKRNLRYDISLIKNKKYRSFLVLIIYKIFGNYFRRKNIWLMGERRDTAQDNTYHLYKYIKEQNIDVNAKYLITKDTDDLKNIKMYSGIVWWDSILHTIYLLTCKFTINSYAERPNMYSEEYMDIIKYYPEYVQNKKVFLQHGVIGVSRVNHVLHKNRVNYDFFVVSSEFEKKHVIEEFGYGESEVIVSGLARWDNLKTNANKKNILLMPTWRSWIKSEEELYSSEYFNRYLELLNNEKFKKVIKDNNFKLTFYPHYQTQKLINKLNFDFGENIKIVKQGEKTVQELINENYILITDYSTVSFDFAYCNKPVVFYQFDYDEFYSKHYNKGPVDHKTELFGYRTENFLEIVEYIDNHKYLIGNKYIKRYINKEKCHCDKILCYLRGV